MVRLDGPELSWSYDDFDGSFHPSELERGPDGTSYVLASNGGPDEVRLYAIANDGSLRWRWELEPQDDGFDGIWFGTIAVHPAGMTIYERRRYPPEQYQWMGLRVEDDELVSEVDIALDHPASEWLLPTPFEGGWLGVSDNRYGGVARLGKLDAAGALDWYREDSATTGWVYGWAANESRIVLVTNTDAEDSNVFVRSYELDGQLRGSLTLDLSVQTDEPVFPEGWGNAAFSLPDGTIVVQVGSVGGTWLVGMRA
ncbi:MAG TPA: hypothetical protein VG755_08760 [Nannocystaceae bacterium]|nr:hypothetical protein [Nannocystaceae bacterium]